ncbi:hypothetical protein C3L33_22448, partial [Rhododendron williamsianum]
MLSCWVEDPHGDSFKKHLARIPDYMWVAENGMKMQCCLMLSQLPQEIVGPKHEVERLYDAMNVILSLQSKNGGISAWEPVKGGAWLELLNPTESFADIVVDREYVECTASAIQALVLFMKLHPGHRKKEIDAFIVDSVHFLEDNQMPDGSWYGNWGLCFTYATWFAWGGLAAGGRLTPIVQLCVRVSNFCCRRNAITEAGERATFLVPSRF